MGDTVGLPDENIVFAFKHAGNAAKLAKMLPDGGIWQRGGDAGEVNGGDASPSGQP